MDHFDKEADFESALIAALQSYGWERRVIDHPTEQDLIRNWADILFENNRDIDRLNDCPLIPEEMDELLEQIRRLSHYLGCSQPLFKKMMESHVTKQNLNEYGRFDALKATVVKDKAQEYFTEIDGRRLPPFRVNNRVDELLTKFILTGGYDIPEPDVRNSD